VACLAGSASAKSYRFERFHSDVDIRSDGSIQVTETITYRFDGQFTYAWRIIPLDRGVTIDEFSVSEHDRTYQSNGTEQPGTYRAAHTEAGLRVQWYYRAADEVRTFTFSYTMTGAVRRYYDVAVYYHKLIGDESDQRIENFSARVSLPLEGGFPSDIRVWAHGPLHGSVTIESAQRVTAEVSPLPVGRFFELRILMPPDAFTAIRVEPTGPALNGILAEEARWAEQANRERERRAAAYQRDAEKRALQEERFRQWFPIAWLLAGLSVFVWVILFRRHGLPHTVALHAAPGVFPSDHPPAVVAQLVSGSAGGPALVATLLDLADRHYLTIEETSETSRGWFGRESQKTNFVFRSTGENPGEMRAYEAKLLEFLLNEVGDGSEFSMKEIKTTARKQKAKYRKWFRKWLKEVKELADSEGLNEPYAVRPMVTNAVCGVAVGGMGIAMSVLSNSPVGIPAMVAGLLQLILTVALHRRTPQGRRLYLEWKGFRKHLVLMSRGKRATHLSSNEWNRYVAMAIIFGVYQKLIPRLSVDETATGAYLPVWYLQAGDGVAGISGLTAGFSSMIGSVSTTMSSASGTGGGASGGGGGGAGGGGAGAG